MAVVLNENKWAEEMLQGNDLGKKPAETFRRIARFYLDQGMSKKEVRVKLDEFLLQCDHRASVVLWSDTLDYAYKKALKFDAITIDSIIITKGEMKQIRALSGKLLQRLAFTLLCLAKYWHEVIPDNQYWVNNKRTEIMSMANIAVTMKKRCSLFYQLKESGLIELSKKVDNTNARVAFVEEKGEPELIINDFRNLGHQYQMYLGEPFFKCKKCGLTVKYSNPSNKCHQKYCPECAAEVDLQTRVNWVMTHRNNNE